MEGEIHHSLEEVRGLNINMGNEETKFNGHRESFDPIELVEAMRSMKMEVQSYREDNEKLIRTQEKKNKLVQSLNQLQKERENELGSRYEDESIPRPSIETPY